jgi:hypothetical protein
MRRFLRGALHSIPAACLTVSHRTETAGSASRRCAFDLSDQHGRPLQAGGGVATLIILAICLGLIIPKLTMDFLDERGQPTA